MPPRRNRDINDIYEQELEQRFMARMDERFNQIVDQLANRINDMMNPRRRRDHNSRGIEGVGKGFVGSYPNFQEDENNVSFSGVVLGVEELMLVYGTDIEDVIKKKKDLSGKEDLMGKKTTSKTARFLIKMPLRRNRDINDIYEQELKQQDVGIITAGEVKVKSQKIRSLRVTVHLLMNNRIDQDEIKWRIIGIGKGFVDSYPNFQDDKNNVSFFGVVLGVKESMPVYDTDIKDVIEEEEGFVGKKGLDGEEDNIKDVVVVANELCSSMTQTTLNVDFEEDINTKSHELMSFGKIILIKDSKSSFKFLIGNKI
ncbi:hypothetical protein Tco_0701882 [Tanacetum coccineum]|uniref:Uncharacterized protein n=1 Tax=Tanacetum coccineum TaxID=301880 RepID=A0ABQ4XV35_9ASTR